MSSAVLKGYCTSSTIYFVWTNNCIHSDELVSRNAGVVQPYMLFLIQILLGRDDQTVRTFLVPHTS